MQSAALLEARRRAPVPVFPVLSVDWTARGYSLGRKLYAPSGRLTAAGQIAAVTKPGGWAPIVYGSGVSKGQLTVVDTSVDIADKAGVLIRMLETYKPWGSAAAISCASPGLVEADWEPVFLGVVDDWARDGLYTRVLLKTDDTLLRTPVPAGVFNRIEWPSAYDTTIYGTHLPLVMGVYDGFSMTTRGMVPAVNIRYDKDLGYWWLATVGHLVDITRVYFDGIDIGNTGGWSVIRAVYGGNRMTILSFEDGSQPAQGVVVSFDCEGVDAAGLYVGPSVTNWARQVRAILEEYSYRPAPLGAWRGPHSIIEDASWTLFAEYLDRRAYDSAKRFGGDQNAETAAELVQSVQDAHPWVRMCWTPLGQIRIWAIDPDDVDPAAVAWFDIRKHDETGRVGWMPGDRREVYSQVKMPFCWSPAEQKFTRQYEAHDVATTGLEQVPLEVNNSWTQGRFTVEEES